MDAALRAFCGYLFLILIVRVVGRRPGKQLTPFEFVLIFFIGGLALTGIVGDERSITNAICQILTIAIAHQCVTLLRGRSAMAARIIDGTPLTLLNQGKWATITLNNMRIQKDDVSFAARNIGTESVEDIDGAILERNGDIGIVPRTGDTP